MYIIIISLYMFKPIVPVKTLQINKRHREFVYKSLQLLLGSYWTHPYPPFIRLHIRQAASAVEPSTYIDVEVVRVQGPEPGEKTQFVLYPKSPQNTCCAVM